MRRYIPDYITNSEKQGFSAPDGSWFKGESIGFVKCELMNDRASIYQWLDQVAVQDLVNQHLYGEQNRRLLIWSLLSVEKFLNQSELT